jgi:hypothetical protein
MGERDDLKYLNKTGLTPLAHKLFKYLWSPSTRLKNDNNTLKTYVDAYEKQKSNTATGAVLLAVSNISVGFGVNILTGNTPKVWPGVSSLIVGVALVVSGIYFTFWKDRH